MGGGCGSYGMGVLALTVLVLVSTIADAEWAAGQASVLHVRPRLSVPGQLGIRDHRSRRSRHSHEVGAGPEPRSAGAA